MFRLPENRILRTTLLASTVVVVLCYAWLASRIMEPKVEFNSKVVRYAAWVDGAAITALAGESALHWREVTQAVQETEQMATASTWLHGSLEPIDLIVRGDDRGRLVITDTRIEIGADNLLADGQLSKAILKSHLLRRASVTISGSLFRLEVVSDALLAIIRGQLNLAVPGESDRLKYSGLQPWWHYARTYGGACASPWRSLELRELCRANHSDDRATAVLSFRPLVGEAIWSAFASSSFSERVSLIRKWTAYLERASGGNDVKGLPNVLAGEIMTIVPPSELPELAEGIRVALTEARLSQILELEADLLIRRETLNDSERASLRALSKARPRTIIIAATQEGSIIFPGEAMLSSDDFKITRVKYEVLRSCESPMLGNITRESATTRKLIWVRTCGASAETAIDYGSLIAGGTELFAKANPGVDFIQLRPESVGLAIKKKQASLNENANDLLRRESKKPSAWFGLAKATWVDTANAYRVNGAIEAVEWHRTAGIKPEAGYRSGF